MHATQNAEDPVQKEVRLLDELQRDAVEQALEFYAVKHGTKVDYEPVFDKAGEPVIDPATGYQKFRPKRDFDIATAGKNLVLKIHDARCKLLGLQAPEKIETINHSDAPEKLVFTVVRAKDGRPIDLKVEEGPSPADAAQ